MNWEEWLLGYGEDEISLTQLSESYEFELLVNESLRLYQMATGVGSECLLYVGVLGKLIEIDDAVWIYFDAGMVSEEYCLNSKPFQ